MKIGNAPPPDQTQSFGGDFKNPNSIVRNTVRISDGEMCVLTFAQDLLDGDCSMYHTVPEVSRYTGGTIYNRYYCAKNENEDGFVISDDCEYCDHKDPEVKKRSRRYSYWAYVYNVYRKQQNPGLEKGYDDAVAWVPQTVGKKNYFVETVNKPQLLQLSTTVWNALEEEISMMEEEEGGMVGSMFRYAHILDANKRHSYTIKESRMRGITAVDGSDLVVMEKELPDLELVLSGQVDEYDFASFSDSANVGMSDDEEDAFDTVQASVEDY